MSRVPPSRGTCARLLVAAGATLALAACAGGAGSGVTAGTSRDVVAVEPAPPDRAATADAPIASGDEPAAVLEIAVAPGTGDDFVGAASDVTDVDCSPGPQGWTATGTVTNPTSAPARYRIYVSFLDDAGDTRGVLQVDVDPVRTGRSSPWSGTLDIAGDSLSCILRVERV